MCLCVCAGSIDACPSTACATRVPATPPSDSGPNRPPPFLRVPIRAGPDLVLYIASSFNVLAKSRTTKTKAMALVIGEWAWTREADRMGKTETGRARSQLDIWPEQPRTA